MCFRTTCKLLYQLFRQLYLRISIAAQIESHTGLKAGCCFFAVDRILILVETIHGVAVWNDQVHGRIGRSSIVAAFYIGIYLLLHMELKLAVDIQGIIAVFSAEHMEQHFVFAQCFCCAGYFFVGVQCHDVQSLRYLLR